MKQIWISLFLLCIYCSKAMAYEVGDFAVSFQGVEPSVKTFCFDSSISLKPKDLAKLWKVLDLKGYQLRNSKEAAYKVNFVKGSSYYSPDEITFVDNANESMPPILTIRVSAHSYKNPEILYYPLFTGLYLFWGNESVILSFTASLGSNKYSKIKKGKWDGSKLKEEYNIEEWKNAESLIMGKDYYNEYYIACTKASNEINDNGPKLANTPIQTTRPEDSITYVDVDNNIYNLNKANDGIFAVIIGNEKYRNETEVPYASNDAKIFGEYVEKTLGVPHDQVRIIENGGYNDLRMAVNWLTQAMTVCRGKGKAIVYYAGHGIPNESDLSAYLLPVDGVGSDPASAFSLKELYDKLSSVEAQSITIFLDACFSGSKREGGMLASARGVALKAKPSAPKGNMVVFTAAQGDETAYPYNDKQHGMFTYFLLKKLQETKGEVTLGELSDYLIEEVGRQSFVKNGKMQTPTTSPSSSFMGNWRTMKLK